MRASEFITETINPDILNPQFKHRQQIGDYIYTAQTKTNWENTNTPMPAPMLQITCYNGMARQPFAIGHALFKIHGKGGDQWLESADTLVANDHRSEGIASTMYAYAKMLGNDIKPSTVQLKPGKDMWKSWKKSGDAKHLVK